MSLGQQLAPHLPFLRRYGRALTGSQAQGDKYVRAALEAIVAAPDQFPRDVDPRLGLYRTFQVIWNSTNFDEAPADSAVEDQESVARARLSRMTPLSRQALLLTAMEGFTPEDAAYLIEVEGFTAVSLSGPDDVSVSVGPGFSVRAEGSGDVLDKLRIEKSGDTLKIGRRSSGWFGSMGGEDAKIYVTMPAIAAANLAGSGDLSVDRASGDVLAMSLAGSGNLSVAALQVKRAEVSIAGSGDVSAAGEADELRIKIAGSGDVDAKRLTTRAADISISGSGGVDATVNGHATVRISGSGDVDLGAGATCDSKVAGSGSVRCGK